MSVTDPILKELKGIFCQIIKKILLTQRFYTYNFLTGKLCSLFYTFKTLYSFSNFNIQS